MSGSSFPRPEHILLLKDAMERLLRARGESMEMAERGLNQLKCQYKFGLRPGLEGEWSELAIHFQVAERLQDSADDSELARLLDGFFSLHSSSH